METSLSEPVKAILDLVLPESQSDLHFPLLSQAIEECESLRQQLSVVQDNLANVNTELDRYKKAYSKSKLESDSLARQKLELQSESNSKIQAAHGTVSVLNVKIQSLTKENEDLKAEVADLNNQLTQKVISPEELYQMIKAFAEKANKGKKTCLSSPSNKRLCISVELLNQAGQPINTGVIFQWDRLNNNSVAWKGYRVD